MKKILLLLAVTFCLKSEAQNVVYLFGMDSNGKPVINYMPIPSVVNTGSYPDLSNRPAAISLTTTGTSGVTRPINSTTFTVSTTKQAFVVYNITISCTATIGSASSGSVALQYSTNAGSTWTTVGTISNTVTLAVALNSAQVSGSQLSGYIPANALVRMVSASAGTTTITYVTGQETY